MKDEELFSNFAMIIPQTAIYTLGGCQIFGATEKEFEEFRSWFLLQDFQQLSINAMKLDMWIRYNDMIIDDVAYSMQRLFEHWKNNPPSSKSFTMTTHKFK